MMELKRFSSSKRLMMQKIWSKVRELPGGVLIGLIANYYAFRGALFLLHIAPGTSIRPTFEGFYAGVAVLLAFVIGVPLSLLEIVHGVNKHNMSVVVLGIFGALLILASWPMGSYWWDYFATQRHITFEH